MPAERSHAIADGRRVPRALHPGAWWIWALCLAVAVERTSNPLLLILVLAVLGFVIARRRTDAPWARAFRYYLTLALVVIAIRIVFRIIFESGVTPSDHILLRLPRIPTPSWYAGVSLGGPVSLEAVLSAAIDGLRLGTLLCCIGAANALANPRRALRVLPGALYELGVAVVVAITVAPQIIDSAQRIARARRLRAGPTHGGRTLRALRAVRALVIPVLEDAFERSLRLAAAMDSRGYGRTGAATARSRRLTGAWTITGLLGLVVGVYGLLDGTAPRYLGVPAIAVGVTASAVALVLGGRRISRSSYRPDPWRAPEWIVAGSALAGVVLLYATASYDAAALTPSLYPLAVPSLPLLPTAAIGLAALAGVAAPPPQRPVAAGPAPSLPARLPEPDVREPVSL